MPRPLTLQIALLSIVLVALANCGRQPPPSATPTYTHEQILATATAILAERQPQADTRERDEPSWPDYPAYPSEQEILHSCFV